MISCITLPQPTPSHVSTKIEKETAENAHLSGGHRIKYISRIGRLEVEPHYRSEGDGLRGFDILRNTEGSICLTIFEESGDTTRSPLL